jgi:agmatinase
VSESLADGGDLELAPDASPRATIEAAIGRLQHAGGHPLVLGGDHSVTYPVVRAVHRATATFQILHLDAHPDLYDEFEGDRFSHACPFARIMEERLTPRLVQVGIRAMTAQQAAQARRFNVEVLDMRAWIAGRRPAMDGPTYLSVDLDVLDPAFAPGLSHPEPGGLSVRDVIGIIQNVPGPIIGADIVEYNPRQDVGGATAVVAAKLVKEIAARMRETGPRS